MTESSPAPIPELADFPVVLDWPVQWGDQDAFGHVNNTIYFRWFESARIAYLERLGLGQMMKGVGVGPILAAINCNYRKQLLYPDRVSIGSRITRIGNASLKMAHAVFSHALGAVAADGESVVVMIDYDSGQTVRVPDSMRQAVASLEGREFS